MLSSTPIYFALYTVCALHHQEIYHFGLTGGLESSYFNGISAAVYRGSGRQSGEKLNFQTGQGYAKSGTNRNIINKNPLTYVWK